MAINGRVPLFKWMLACSVVALSIICVVLSIKIKNVENKAEAAAGPCEINQQSAGCREYVCNLARNVGFEDQFHHCTPAKGVKP